MKHDIFLKKYLTFVFAAVLLFTTLSGILPINGEEALYDKILRLHVIANSDSESDQSLKLTVRDEVLKTLLCLYEENCVTTKDEAEKVINSSIEIITENAEKVIKALGENYEVETILCKEYYPTRKYEKITLPAGTYTSLQIKIGNAEGKNWWCVLFPTLCLSSAAVYDTPEEPYVYNENGEEFIAAGFTPAEIRIITESDEPDVKVKFKILEIFGK